MKSMNAQMMDAIFEVFEKMFYIFLEPLAVDGRPGELTASIHFDGAAAGRVKIKLSQGMAARMAHNMLGLEEDHVQDAILQDCTKEALNMICGNILDKIDPDSVFRLSLPEIGTGEAPGCFDTAGGAFMSFLFESDGEWIGVETILKTAEMTEG
jgi:CheY-specific phosphatase CheX